MAGERLDEILSREWKERPHEWEVTNSTFAAERQAYMSRLRSLPQYRGPQGDDEDGDNLVLDHLAIDPTSERLKLHPAIATYGQIVRSCDALLNEFAVFGYLGRDLTAELSWLGRVGQAKLLRSLRIGRPIDLRPVHALRLLPWRNAVHRWAERPEHLFLAPRKRAAGLGVAVTMLKQDSEHPTAFVARRSSVVGTYPDVLHVVPAGMCNAKDDLRADRRPIRNDFLRWTMIGELLEECYDVEELADYRTEDWVAHVSEECAVRSVSTTAPIFTGLAFDFLNLRPEICSRVDVVDPDDKAMQREHFKLCWEYSRRHGVTELELSRVVDFCDGTDFVQSGIASLALARISVDNETEER
jgi:hypothetical protein